MPATLCDLTRAVEPRQRGLGEVLPRPSPRARNGNRQFGVLVCGLALIAVLGGIVMWPTLSREYLRRMAIPRHGESFGFTFGPIGDTTHGQWGFTHVMPGGALERAGVRAGDVPFEYHGGEAALHTVLVAGRGRFLVVHGGPDPRDRPAVREISLGSIIP